MHKLVKAMKSLSDETRLRIINLVMTRECCVCEVMQALEISPTRASRNLNLLYNAGFLKMRREGLWALYSLDEDMPPYQAKLVEAVGLALADYRAALDDRKRLKSASRTGQVCLPQGKKARSKGLLV